MAKRRKIIKRRHLSSRNKGLAAIFRFIFKYLPALLVAAILIVGVRAGLECFFNSNYFTIKNIRIKGEDSAKRSKPITDALLPQKGLNIFDVDLKWCESDIRRRYPELKDIRVKRILPDVMEVSYKTRKPFCQVESGYYYSVSSDAVVLPQPQQDRVSGLCLITGIRITESKSAYAKPLQRAVSLLKEVQESSFSRKYRVTEINVYDPKNPAIFIDDSTRVEIGEYNFKDKKKILEKMLEEMSQRGKKAKVIDLRFEDVVVVPY